MPSIARNTPKHYRGPRSFGSNEPYSHEPRGPFETVELHPSVIEELQEIAQRDGVSLRRVVYTAVNRFLDSES